MKDDAEKKHRAKPTARELDLIESLRRNPKLMDHIEELAMMTRTPKDLLKDGNQAESKIIGLCRGVGRASLQGWAEAANRDAHARAEASKAKGQHRHSKKNSTG